MEEGNNNYDYNQFFTSENVPRDFNLEIWNNKRVRRLTGYSIDDIKECLYDISIFISQNLQPDRLRNFNIENIMTVKACDNSITSENIKIKINGDWN